MCILEHLPPHVSNMVYHISSLNIGCLIVREVVTYIASHVFYLFHSINSSLNIYSLQSKDFPASTSKSILPVCSVAVNDTPKNRLELGS